MEHEMAIRHAWNGCNNTSTAETRQMQRHYRQYARVERVWYGALALGLVFALGFIVGAFVL